MFSKKRKLVLARAELLVLSTAVPAWLHCGGPASTDAGQVAMQLTLPDGTDLNEVSYATAGGPTALSGTIDVSRSATVSATLGPLAAGSGYTLQMKAVSKAGPCAGSAGPFTVVAGRVTPVAIVLTCPSAHNFGAVAVSGQISDCPGIDAIVASPSEVRIGSDIQLTAIAGPRDTANPLLYGWTGVTTSDQRGNAGFHCEIPGKYTVALTVSNGNAACYGPDAAPPTGTVTLTCTDLDRSLDAAVPDDAHASSDFDASSSNDATTTADADTTADVAAPVDASGTFDTLPDAPVDAAADAGVRVNLAQGMPTTADSQQTSKGNLAPNATDGKTTTRWSAADGNLNHWLTVDLGNITSLTGTEVLWEAANPYGYRIEVSTDNTNWTLVAGPKTSGGQLDSDAFTASGRYIRLTVTSLPTRVWASAWEFRAFGQ